MSVYVLEGLPGAGKSVRLAKEALFLLERNRRLSEKTEGRLHRRVMSNLKFSDWVEEEYRDFIRYWEEPEELQEVRDCDVLWDEMGVHLDATQWENLPQSVRRWFQQHRKLGIDIAGTCQDFGQVDKSVRRVVERVGRCNKMWGSPPPSATRPEIERIWGIVSLRWVDGRSWRDDSQAGVQISWGFPRFFFITKRLCSAFDTTQCVVSSNVVKLRHIKQLCSTCGYSRVRHV